MASYDSWFTFLCAPNDTHNCMLKAMLRTVVIYLGPSYGYGKSEDVYGNKASHRWDPRCCQKGLALIRRIYGPRRVKYPSVRKGFKEWVDGTFGENGKVDQKYLQRGKEPFVRVSWDEVYKIVAQTPTMWLELTTEKKGAENLGQGYDHDMVGSHARCRRAGLEASRRDAAPAPRAYSA